MSPVPTTKTVTYIGRHDSVYVPLGQLEVHCARGESIEVPAEVADSLLDQTANWAEPKTEPAKREPKPKTDKVEED